MINTQLDIKLGQFTEEEVNIVLTKIRSRKAASLNEIPPEIWKTTKFDDLLLWLCNTLYEQNTIERWMKGCILPFLKKDDLGSTKKKRGKTLTSMAVKVYNACLNHIKPEIKKIIRKIRMVSREINPELFRFKLFGKSLKEYMQKILRQHYCY